MLTPKQTPEQTPVQTPIHSAHLNIKMLNFPNYNFPGNMSPYSQISNRGWHFKRNLGKIVRHWTFFLLLCIKVVWQKLFTTLQNPQIGKIPWGFFHRCWRSVVHVQNWGKDACTSPLALPLPGKCPWRSWIRQSRFPKGETEI